MASHRIGSDITGTLFCHCGEWDESDGSRFEDHLHDVHSKPWLRYDDLQAQHEVEIQENLMRGRMPCRFCGIEWLTDEGRHDPLRMAGVHTLVGTGRYWSRAIDVGIGRLLRPRSLKRFLRSRHS